MLIKSYLTKKCINGCNLFNDKDKYLYWEKKKTSTDEIELVRFLNKNNFGKRKTILHIGIGNSYLAKNLKNYKKIDGISISTNELDNARVLKIKGYKLIFFNKFSSNGFYKKHFKYYDFIIDVNMKSFSCCQEAFENLFFNYSRLLKSKGKIFTSKRGMKWSRIVKPVLRFSFKNLFYKKLKEFDGPKENILKIRECLALSKKHNLKYTEDKKSKIAFFKKL